MVRLALPVLVGYLYRLMFEATSREVFVTCAASTYVMGLAELFGEVALTGGSLFDLLWAFVAEVPLALFGVLLIVVGSAIGRRHTIKGKIASAQIAWSGRRRPRSTFCRPTSVIEI